MQKNCENETPVACSNIQPHIETNHSVALIEFQVMYDILVVDPPNSPLKCRFTSIVPGIHGDSLLHQKLHNRKVALETCPMERCVPLSILAIDVGSVRNQEPNDRKVTTSACKAKCWPS